MGHVAHMQIDEIATPLLAVNGQIEHRQIPDRMLVLQVNADRFEVLLTLIAAYEAKHFQINLPDPVEAIKFRMEQGGLTPKDLVPAIGRLNRAYEILVHKCPLTLNMIWRLDEKFGIPAESLIRPGKLSAAA